VIPIASTVRIVATGKEGTVVKILTSLPDELTTYGVLLGKWPGDSYFGPPRLLPMFAECDLQVQPTEQSSAQ
jgi:hypothetical protein